MNSFKDDWQKVPFIRITVPFILGIVFQEAFPCSFSYISTLIVFFLLLFLFFLFLKKVQLYSLRWISGLFVIIVLFLCGMLRYEKSVPEHVQLPDNENTYIGIVTNTPKITQKSVKFELEITHIKDSAFRTKTPVRLLIYTEKTKSAQQLDLGDKIIFRGRIAEINNKGNPQEFDYKKYLKHKDIFYSVFLSENKWKLISKNNAPFYKQIPYRARKTLISELENHGIKGQEKAIVAALTLGYKADLSKETKSAFASSGAMHLLAVSGLHVGIVYTLLSFILRKMLKIRSKVFIWLAISSGIWVFAILSGCSPSVNRAALMFTLIAFGKSINRPANTYNIIAASAFILLLIDPKTVFSVGFQLSYIAVLSIITFYPIVFNLIYCKNKVTNYIWQINAVTLSAQIGTLPITLYYFNQFPTYSLLTNLLIIQLAPAVMFTAIVFQVFTFWGEAANYLGIVLSYLVNAMHFIAKHIESFPKSVIENIYIDMTWVIGLFLIILLLLYHFSYINKRMLYASLCVMFLLSVHNFIQNIEKNSSREFVVFNSPKNSVYSFVENDIAYCFINNQLKKEPEKLEFLTKNYFSSKKIEETIIEKIPSSKEEYAKNEFQLNTLKYHKNMVFFANKSFCFINDKNTFGHIPLEAIKINYLVLGTNLKQNMDDILRFFRPDKIIIDSNVSKYQKNMWTSECKRKNIDCHAVADKGAFVLNL